MRRGEQAPYNGNASSLPPPMVVFYADSRPEPQPEPTPSEQEDK